MVSRSAIRCFFRSAAIVAALGGVLFAAPAWADGGAAVDEGYVKVQQALSFLVTDTTPAGIAQASAMIDDALASADQDGVSVTEVRQAKTVLEAGRTGEARVLLQDSISAALAALEPAKGEETGTRVVIGPLASQSFLSPTDWVFLALSAIVALLGLALAIAFRPNESLRDLRRHILAARNLRGDPSRRSDKSGVR